MTWFISHHSRGGSDSSGSKTHMQVMLPFLRRFTRISEVHTISLVFTNGIASNEMNQSIESNKMVHSQLEMGLLSSLKIK